MAALGAAWGRPAQLPAAGGSIPIVMSLHEAVPMSHQVRFGAIDGFANIHAPNERVLVSELERATVAMALFFEEFSARAGAARGDT